MTAPTRPRATLIALSPKLHRCPRCGAARGDWCKSTGGYQTSLTGFHAARRKLVADLPDDDAYAAMTELFDEDDARQAAVRSASRQPLTAAQETTRRNISAAWNRIRADLRAEERDLRARCTDTPHYGMRSHADDCQCRIHGDVSYTAAVVEARRLEALRGQLPVTDLSEARAKRRRVTTTSSTPEGAA